MGMKSYRYLEYTFDDGRYERSKDIVVLPIDEDGEKLPEYHYMAFGSDAGTSHYCTTRPHPDCDCHDFSWGNDRLCKHLIAALEFEGDELLEATIAGIPVTECKVTLVCGPPASGKTTFVKACAEFGDFIWDMDAVANATIWGKTHATAETQRILRAMRDAAIVELERAVKGGAGLKQAWIIWSLPKPSNRDRLAKRLNADVIVIEAQPDICASRVEDNQKAQVERAGHRWWEDYSRREGEHVITYEE